MGATAEIFRSLDKLRDIAAIGGAATLWVNPTVGNNSTALRNRLDRPFATIAAAEAACSDWDTIFIRGFPNEINLGRHKTHYHFDGGGMDVVQELTADTPQIVVFDFQNKAVLVTGYPSMSVTVTEDAPSNGGSPNIYIFKASGTSDVDIEWRSETFDVTLDLGANDTVGVVHDGGPGKYYCRGSTSVHIGGGAVSLTAADCTVQITGGTRHDLRANTVTLNVSGGTEVHCDAYVATVSGLSAAKLNLTAHSASVTASGGTGHQLDIGTLTSSSLSGGSGVLRVGTLVGPLATTGSSGTWTIKPVQLGVIGQTTNALSVATSGTAKTMIEGGYAQWGTQIAVDPVVWFKTGHAHWKGGTIHDLGTGAVAGRDQPIVYGHASGATNVVLEDLTVIGTDTVHKCIRVVAELIRPASTLAIKGGIYYSGLTNNGVSGGGSWLDFEAQFDNFAVDIVGEVTVNSAVGFYTNTSGSGVAGAAHGTRGGNITLNTDLTL